MYKNNYMKTLYLPKNLITIERYSDSYDDLFLEKYEVLHDIYVDHGNPYYYSKDHCLYSKKEGLCITPNMRKVSTNTDY